MRPVYALTGGVSKFAKARPDKTFQAVIKEAYDYAIADIGLDFPTFTRLVDGSLFLGSFRPPIDGRHHGPGLPGIMPEAGSSGGRRRGYRRDLFPGSLEIGGERTHGRMCCVWLRDHVACGNVEGK